MGIDKQVILKLFFTKNLVESLLKGLHSIGVG